MARPPNFAMLSSYRHFKTVGDPPGADNESVRDFIGKKLIGSRLEQFEPAIEVFAFKRQYKMRPQRPATVATRAQHDR